MELYDIIYKEYSKILENKTDMSKMISENIDINEQFEFGHYTVDGSGSAIIKDTLRITSPIEGRISNSMVKSSSCKNPVVIVSRNGDYFLEYCNIANVRISDNSKVNSEDLIGKALDDVKVTLYNKKGSKVKIDSDEAMKLVFGSSFDKEKKSKDSKDPKSPEYKKERPGMRSGEPLISGLFQLPFKALAYPFKNKYDKSGKLTQKRWGSPVDKRQVDPWILQSIKDPFGIKRRKKEKEGDITEEDKLTEEINRIKQLIK